ncbi:MAG: VOC family protein [Cellvibrionales bacterium]|nr:VOC family protein [Cellvibrionales bacterium]
MKIGGFQEAVLHVSDLRHYQHFWQTIGGWRLLCAGSLEPQWQAIWGLNCGGRQALLGNLGDSRGTVRLIQLDEIPALQIRSDAQAWEVGGILDLNIRVLDIARKHRQMQRRGWRGSSNPVRWQWGQTEIIEWLGHGPDGVSLALIERIVPPLDGFANLREFSCLINSTQIVTDLNVTRALFEEVLDFKVVRHSIGSQQQPGENVFGLPHSLIHALPHEVIVLHPAGIIDGSIELIGFKGLSGRDFSVRARPANLGIAALRFPVDDIGALEKRLKSHGTPIRHGPIRIPLIPYGEICMLAIQTPDGAWLEFYQQMSTAGMQS